jgi:hypothetical protein
MNVSYSASRAVCMQLIPEVLSLYITNIRIWYKEIMNSSKVCSKSACCDVYSD